VTDDTPQICDYEGDDYRTRFWEGRGRDYEDRVERIAIERLMPPTGNRLIEVGAGFGRLAPLYRGYRQVALFDYSRSQLEFAREQYGDDGFLYVAGNVYEMPFAPRAFDTVLMVRVLHHMEDAPAALRSIRYIMGRSGTFILEFANKQNLKAIARWLLRRQDWNPFNHDSVEFARLNFDFHPSYVRDTLKQVGFDPGRTLTVSHFRIGLLKRLIPTGVLVAMDSLAQCTGNLWQLSPSVFVRNEAVGEDSPAPAGAFWRCPSCGSFDLTEDVDGLTCPSCGNSYLKRNGVYDFKEPVTTRK
jgi:SAM-dependent methyltransferase